MVDYLEETLENAARLLKRVRKLEHIPFARMERKTPRTETGSGAPSRHRADMLLNSGVAEEDAAGIGNTEYSQHRSAPGGLGKLSLDGTDRSAGAGLEKAGGTVLLRRIEELERAAPPLYKFTQPGGESKIFSGSETVPLGPDGERKSGFGTFTSLPGEEICWAEQADRVFCRDSRRYDGSFYLY